MIEVPPRTIVYFADIACPWAHVAVHRLHEARRRLGVGITLEPRAFPLELFNRRPTPKPILDAEMPVAGALEPNAGWQVWQRLPWEWPVTTLPALDAVAAAKQQSLDAAAELDRALRAALFRDSRCISMRHEILEVARTCDAIDAGKLEAMLDEGAGRAAVMNDLAAASGDEVAGSPHVFLPDRTDVHNPGIQMHWEGEHGRGFPVVDADDASVYEELLVRAEKEE